MTDDPRKKRRTIRKIRRVAAFGALLLKGPREAVSAWRDIEMAEEAYRRGYR